MIRKEITYSLNELNQIAKQILSSAQEHSTHVFAFYGKMGSGKTTLIKAIGNRLGVVDTVQSPTFSIINQYKLSDGGSIYHFDFYRLDKIDDAINIGVEDYLYSSDICLIEWPEIIEPLLPQNTLRIKIEILDNNTRKIIINALEESIDNNSSL